MLLGAGAKARVVLLREVADLRAVADDAATAQVGEGPDPYVVTDLGLLDHARPHSAALAYFGVDQLAAGFDARIAADACRATQDDVRLDGHVRRDLDRSLDRHGSRIVQRDPGLHQPLQDRVLEVDLDLGQVGPIVDASELGFSVRLVGLVGCDSRLAVGGGQHDQLGEVQLAGGR